MAKCLTFYLQDIITDLSADCEDLTLEDLLENGLVHKVCVYSLPLQSNIFKGKIKVPIVFLQLRERALSESD